MEILEAFRVTIESIKKWIENKKFATEDFVSNSISTIDMPSGFVTQSEPPEDTSLLWVDIDDSADLIGYATEEYVDNAINNKQDKSNLVTIITDNSTDIQYPSARAVASFSIGRKGTGLRSEKFNNPSNVASGSDSHAEGQGTTASGMASHAEGISTIAKSDGAHAEGESTIAYTTGSHAEGKSAQAGGESDSAIGGSYAHAEGVSTIAKNRGSHAEGNLTKAFGDYSHAEGNETQATAVDTHSEGRLTKAMTRQAHAEGDSTLAGNGTRDVSNLSPLSAYGVGAAAHAEGIGTFSKGGAAHAEGYKTQATGNASHAEGNSTEASGESSHAEGESTLASAQCSHAEGGGCQALGDYSHAEGCNDGNFSTIARGQGSHAEGIGTQSTGNGSHAEGKSTTASGLASHAEGNNSQTDGQAAHAEGEATKAYGNGAHAEGKNTIAGTSDRLKIGAHAEGLESQALNSSAHAEGYNTRATGDSSHSEGNSTTASGAKAHAEGEGTLAQGVASHAEGGNCQAIGDYSHAEGIGTIAKADAQNVIGKYNEEDVNWNYVHIVGNGSSDADRKNIHTLSWNGSSWFAGEIKVGGLGDSDPEAKNVLLEGDAIPIPATAKVGQAIAVKAIDENGRPTEWEAVNATNHVNVDWNKNNTDDLGYIKNRPFYECNNEVIIDIQVAMELYMGNSASRPHGKHLIFESGAKYRVYFDQSIAEVVANDTNAIAFSVDGMNIRVDSTYLTVEYPSTQSLTLFKIEKIEELKQLDEKFIPNTIARKADLDAHSHLPDVSTADNGKILMVVNGVWTAVSVNLSIDSDGILTI